MPLDLASDVVSLTAALVDIESVSHHEAEITELVETALQAYPSLSVERDGNVVIARTELGRAQRVALAGHLDTVPIADNVPSRREGDRLYGCGTADMKSGVAVMLRMAHLVGSGALDPTVDITWVAYDCEEVDAASNGLGRIARESPDKLACDLGVLLEPSAGLIEGGCQGTMRAVIRVTGVRAHSARSWLGVNAIHAAGAVMQRLEEYEPRTVVIDGLTYREGLNAVLISGGVAGNIIPDECRVTVNYRFAPDMSEAQAHQHVRDVFSGYELEIVDSAPSARPGLDGALAQALVGAVGGEPRAKLGWTDVSRFGELGIPAVNFGPGDPDLAHKVEEWVGVDAVTGAEAAMLRFLSA